MIHWAKLGSLEAHSRDHEETRYLATTVIVSCSRCNFREEGSPMWTKWVLRYLKPLLFLYFKKNSQEQKDAGTRTHTHTQKKKKNSWWASRFKREYHEPEWYHTDSSIKLLSVSLCALSHPVINVIINQTASHSALINLISYCKCQARHLCSETANHLQGDQLIFYTISLTMCIAYLDSKIWFLENHVCFSLLLFSYHSHNYIRKLCFLRQFTNVSEGHKLRASIRSVKLL